MEQRRFGRFTRRLVASGTVATLLLGMLAVTAPVAAAEAIVPKTVLTAEISSLASAAADPPVYRAPSAPSTISAYHVELPIVSTTNLLPSVVPEL